MENYRELLKSKLNDEFEDYKKDLLTKDKENIFKESYQTNIKEQIKYFLTDISQDYSNDKLKSIYNTDNVLDTFYNDWIKWDSPFSINLEDSIFDSIGRTPNRSLEDRERL